MCPQLKEGVVGRRPGCLQLFKHIVIKKIPFMKLVLPVWDLDNFHRRSEINIQKIFLSIDALFNWEKIS